MHAISWRDAMIVDVLLRYKAQVNAIDSVSGKTALHRACALRESALTHTSTVMDLVNTLSKYDADWTITDKVTQTHVYQWFYCTNPYRI